MSLETATPAPAAAAAAPTHAVFRASGGQRFALSLAHVERLEAIDPRRVAPWPGRQSSGIARLTSLGGEVLPIVNPGDLLDGPSDPSARPSVLAQSTEWLLARLRGGRVLLEIEAFLETRVIPEGVPLESTSNASVQAITLESGETFWLLDPERLSAQLSSHHGVFA